MAKEVMPKLLKKLSRGKWSYLYADFCCDHLWPLSEKFGIELSDVKILLGQGYHDVLLSAVVEGVLGAELPFFGETFVHHLTTGFGRSFKGQEAERLLDLSRTPVSLYQVVAVSPGKSLTLSDFFKDTPDEIVFDVNASNYVKLDDCIATRVLNGPGGSTLSGVLFKYSSDGARRLIRDLSKACEGRAGIGGLLIEDRVLHALSHLFTSIWLDDFLSTHLSVPLATVSDVGLFDNVYQLKFPISDLSSRYVIRELIERDIGLSRLVGDSWSILDTESESDLNPDDGAVSGGCLGELALVGRNVCASFVGQSNEEKVKSAVERVLGDAIGSPELAVETSLLVGSRLLSEAGETFGKTSFNSVVDQYFSRVLNSPMREFGGLSPRAFSRLSDKRETLVEWVLSVEKSSMDVFMTAGLASYSFDWFWHELGLQRSAHFEQVRKEEVLV